MNYTARAFTIVEVLVTIVVIAILASIVTISYSSYLRDARDTTRETNATIISEALEKYYAKNGEYPSVPAVTSSNASSVTQLVTLSDPKTLVMPGAASGTTNSIKADPPSTIILQYSASSDVNDSQCKTNAAGGCDQWTMTYRTESNQTITIESRQSGQPAGTPPTAPSAPTISAAQSDTNIIAEVNPVTCDGTSLIAEYSFQRQIGTGAWSSWGSWSDSVSASYSGNTDGVSYQFRAKARCMNGVTPGAESALSNIATVTYVAPLETPAAPATTAAMSGTNAIGTAAIASCSVGTQEYRLQSRGSATSATGSWSAWSSWASTRTLSVAANQGYKYGFQAQARCVQGANVSTASAVGSVGEVTRPIATPSAPIVSSNTAGATTTFTRSNVTCPTGNSVRYQYKYWADYGYDSEWYGPTTVGSFSWGTSSQGYEYRVYLQSQCYTDHASSAWSASGYSGYIRPVNGPSGLSYGIAKPNASTVHVMATSSCDSSVGLYSRADVHTWDIGWTDNGQLGWYGNSHATWSLHNWGYYGNTVITGSVRNNGGVMPSGTRWNIAVDLTCRNSITGRQSATTGRLESGTMVLP